MSEKLLVSHHDNNYAGAVKNLNGVEADGGWVDGAGDSHEGAFAFGLAQLCVERSRNRRTDKARSVAPSSPRHITTSVAERDGGCGVCRTAGTVLAAIDAKDPNPFSFHPRIVAGNVDKP